MNEFILDGRYLHKWLKPDSITSPTLQRATEPFVSFVMSALFAGNLLTSHGNYYVQRLIN